jgi:hypothetical protein
MSRIRTCLSFVIVSMILQSFLATFTVNKLLTAFTIFPARFDVDLDLPSITKSMEHILHIAYGSHMVTTTTTTTTRTLSTLSNSSDKSFSACLLVMDDNHRLSEWLAYHYFVLKLRTLIITIDPKSQTSPTEILNKWRAHGMHIIEWNESYLLKHSEPNNDKKKNISAINVHRKRQQVFLLECMREMQVLNRTWTALWDSDEFIVWNLKATSIVQLKNMTQRVIIPSIKVQDGLLTFLQRHSNVSDQLKAPCITIPRLLFAAVESTEQQIQNNVPVFINATHHDTLRWRKHAKRNDHSTNGYGKTIIDVSRVNLTGIDRAKNPHRPLMDECKFAHLDNALSIFGVNHYLGSWESYSARVHDARKNVQRSTEAWELKRILASEGSDDTIRDWMSGFVEKHGETKAVELLAGAGYIPDRRDPTKIDPKKEWHGEWADELKRFYGPNSSRVPTSREVYNHLHMLGGHTMRKQMKRRRRQTKKQIERKAKRRQRGG